MIIVSIDHALAARLPDLALGVILAQVSTTPTGGAHREAVGRAARLRASSSLAEVLTSASVSATRDAFRRLGRDPSRYRASNEALLRRIFAGKEVPAIVPVVDVNSAVSIASMMPCGVYDLDRVRGDVVFRAGMEGERYEGIGKGVLELADMPVLADDQPFGSPVSDSRRTLIGPSTTRVMMVVMSFAGKSPLPAALDDAITLLSVHARGTAIEHVLCEAPR